MTNRSHALDALRGFAIMMMVLSAMEVYNVLPGFMYHAQEPPPDHVFNPNIFGITWVDLVFPFFLFSMGAAIPLSYRRQLEKGATRWRLAWKSIVRWLKLSFFAFFYAHMIPYKLGYHSSLLNSLVSLLAFALMFLLFMRNPFHLPQIWNRITNGIAYAVAIAWIVLQPYADGKLFSLYDSDIIIIILAHVAVTGSLIYLLTMGHKMLRFAIIPVIIALHLSSHTDGSWQQWFLESSPLSWLWQWSYNVYLIIILPGTIVGDLLWESLHSKVVSPCDKSIAETVLPFIIIVTNVVCLYNRWLIANLLISIAAVTVLMLITRKDGVRSYWFRLAAFASYLLFLGLCFEAYEGGIRKDYVTFSYLLVTGGLACFALLFFTVVCDCWHIKWVSSPLELTGRNPMIAYVAGAIVVDPILTILNAWDPIVALTPTPWLGFLRGVVLTALTMSIAIACTKLKWYWKT